MEESEYGRLRITKVIATEDFLLFMQFENGECRSLNIKEFLNEEEGLLAELRDQLELFLTARIDGLSGTVIWQNGVDFDPAILYMASQKADISDIEL